jgi:hypothetical protein
MTAVQELISEFEEIKKTKCKTLQEVMFFDGVLAIIEGKYLEKEKQQIIDARVNGVAEGIDIGARPIGQPITEDISKNHEIYYNETFNK